MRFLVDESCNATIAGSLRDRGHDVLLVANLAPRATDVHVIELAVADRRVLLTEDKEFGQMVYASGTPRWSVILLRYKPAAKATVIETLVELVSQKGEEITGRFVVVQPGRIRLGGSPSAPDVT
jgi:predicted nuclease of predicted toxin-antitoxin system